MPVEVMEIVQAPALADEDFDVFAVPGLEARMTELKLQLRPKLEQLGQQFGPLLSRHLATPMYAHVAKHARRKTNPPVDSWVAFSQDARGYKKWPTFMVGLWQTHLFVHFGVIYESPLKGQFGQRLATAGVTELRRLLSDESFVYADHTIPGQYRLGDLDDMAITQRLQRVQTVKNADLLFGFELPRHTAVSLAASELSEWIESALVRLAPLYTQVMSPGD